jgi:sortase B
LNDSQEKRLKIIGRISTVVDYFILVVSVLMLLLGMYALWDTHKVYELADSQMYAQYKPYDNPSDEERLSYDELRRINPDVIGWIDVYGTEIDYPVLQSTDNDRYMDETATGEYSVAGSIFLDYRNSIDFSDFNNIVYGHHMDERKMFGDVGRFTEKKFFEEHRYGKLYRNDKKSLGIEFFAIIRTTGADGRIFDAGMRDAQLKRELLDYLHYNAIQSRDVSVTENDSIILMNTCTFTITDGRHILAGKLTDKVHKNPFPDKNENNPFAEFLKKGENINLMWLLIVLLFILIVTYLLYERYQKKKGTMTDDKESLS